MEEERKIISFNEREAYNNKTCLSHSIFILIQIYFIGIVSHRLQQCDV